jgi:hypothetical protein
MLLFLSRTRKSSAYNPVQTVVDWIFTASLLYFYVGFGFYGIWRQALRNFIILRN